MNTALIIMEFLPLFIYIAMDAWKGFKAGIIAAIASTAVMLIYDYRVFGELDKFVAGEALMILLLGLISLKMNNDRFFKFQPTVLAVIFSCVFAWFQFFDQPLMLHLIPHIEKVFKVETLTTKGDVAAQAAAEEPLPILQVIHTEEFQRLLARLSGQMIWLFLGHALIMGYAAMYLPTKLWFAWRLAFYPAVFLLMMINQIFP